MRRRDDPRSGTLFNDRQCMLLRRLCKSFTDVQSVFTLSCNKSRELPPKHVHTPIYLGFSNDCDTSSKVHVKVFYRRKEGCYFAKAGVTHFAKDTFDSLFVSLVSLNLFLHVDKTSEGGVVNRVRDWVIRDCDRKEVGRIRGATQRSEVTLPVYRNDVLTFQEVVREVIERPMWFNANVELLSKHAPHVSVGGFRSRLSPSELYVPFAAALHLPPPPPPPPPPSQPLYPHARDLFFSDSKRVYFPSTRSIGRAEHAAIDIPVQIPIPVPIPVQSKPLGDINRFNDDKISIIHEGTGRERADLQQANEANELIDLLVSGSMSLW